MLTHATERFVGRTTELDALLQAVAGLRIGVPHQRCLINICGVHGIGKSALLAALYQRAAGKGDLYTLRLDLPQLLPEDKELTPATQQLVLEQISAAVGRSAQAALPAEPDAALATLAADLIEACKPILLLIDVEQRASAALYSWLERGLLLPLVRAECLVAMIASRSPLRWREFDTRRRARTLTLPPLSLTETATQLGLSPAATSAVYQLSAGLPLANEVVRDLVIGQDDPANWDQSSLSQALLAALYQRMGAGLTPELRCMLDVLSVVREFALPLLQALLPFCDAEGRSRNQAFQLLVIKQLQELDLIFWDEATLSYRVAPVIHQLVAGALRRANPERYRAVQRTAIEYYRQMLDEVLVSRHVHLLELFWHSLDSEIAAGQTPHALLRELVTHYLTSPDGHQIDREAVMALRAQIAADPELAVVLQRYGADLTTMVSALSPR